MTWTYQQSTGKLWAPRGRQITVGYSGHGEGKNSPAHQDIRNVGPIPRGLWRIGPAYDSQRVGPMALPLDPIGHDCCGRTYFRAHGDSAKHPGEASKGCVILGRMIRERINASPDKELMVVE